MVVQIFGERSPAGVLEMQRKHKFAAASKALHSHPEAACIIH